MATIYPRGARWWIKWTDGTGAIQQKSLGRSVRTRREAEAARRALERSLDEGPTALPATTTLGDAIDDFLADKLAKRERVTWQHYRKHANRFAELLPVAAPLDSITTAHLERYLAERAKAVSKTTANKELTTLRVLWTWLLKRGLATRNPAAAVEPFSARKVPRPRCSAEAYLAHVAALRADAAARAREDERFPRLLYADVLEAIWWSGARIGEVCALEPGDVDLQARSLTLRSARNKGPRVLPIAGPVEAIYRRHMARGRRYVFATLDGGHALNALTLLRRGWLKEHPEDKPVAPHALRHAFSDRARVAGVDLMLRSKGLLGHSTVQTTRIYSHEELPELRAAMEQIEAADEASAVKRPARGEAPSPQPGRAPPPRP